MVFLFLPILIALVCGKDARIVGGDKVTDTTSFPWLVALIHRNITDENNGIANNTDYFNKQFCGGSIINESWILTAAHCTAEISYIGDVAIVAAIYDLSTTMGQLRNVIGIYEHEEYDSNTLRNDIALLELEQPLVLSDSVEVILPANTDDPLEDGQIYTLAGWGANSMNGTIYSPYLFTVDVPGVNLQSCIIELVAVLDDTNICAGDVYGEDSCQGDSGGPMTMEVDSVEILYGIVSWGEECASGAPAVYTAVAMYRDWIQETAGLELGNPASSSSSSSEIYIIVGCVLGALLIIAVIVLLWCFCRKSKVEREVATM